MLTQRNATQRNATQRNATQRNATQRNATQRKYLFYKTKSKVHFLKNFFLNNSQL